VAADDDGAVVASARVAHPLVVPSADHLEHDAGRAWRTGVRRALTEVAEVAAGRPIAGVCVAAMVPSMTAVTARGRPVAPGLLYGDARGGGDGIEMLGFLRWLAGTAPDARGYWPAQAVANHALCGRGALDSTSAFTAFPLFDGTGWDADLVSSAGASVSQLPDVVSGFDAVGRVDGDGPLLTGGTIDAMGEQLVAGADDDGDVLVILGTTLITWAVSPDWVERDNGVWVIPHTAAGKSLVGGPSNAGGLFLDRVRRLVGRRTIDDAAAIAPDDVPVWLPYVRGERTPLHRADLRAELHDMSLSHDGASVLRAAHEAAGFVVRHHLDLAAVTPPPRRLVATGGGARSEAWVQALADCTGLPVDVVAVPEGAALGAAFVARCTAGLEEAMTDARRWARVARTVEPRRAWADACDARYERFRALTRAAAAR
jgi:xylulokinase